jgi:hypothetical protein
MLWRSSAGVLWPRISTWPSVERGSVGSESVGAVLREECFRLLSIGKIATWSQNRYPHAATAQVPEPTDARPSETWSADRARLIQLLGAEPQCPRISHEATAQIAATNDQL